MPKTVYLQPLDLVKHSRLHTAYASDGPAQGGSIYKIEFINGVAHDVPENVYQRFKDLRIADVKRPVIPRPEDVEDDTL